MVSVVSVAVAAPDRKEAAVTDRPLNVVRASDVTVDPEGARIAEAARRAALDVLPEEWRVLPDGRATHSVIATLTARLARTTDEKGA